MHGRDIFLPGLHGEDCTGGWQMPRLRLQREYGKRPAERLFRGASVCMGYFSTMMEVALKLEASV